ncbi:energy transducer TonB [Inhella gelatinilytica]|uniref:Energy transducer TonB n=1 Tax=Inhella gelatinilytica TaxID=2795030 RepID=A0A931NC79_9BURK|nr:energy transducer TonB [Inhella gelatinilytica]MBH9551284.1 energy transducer TonB [Inhella gelatinilytica]
MGLSVWGRFTAVAAAALLVVVPAVAQDSGKLSDQERAKRDAEKVFRFIKFQTVRSANKDKDEKKDEKKAAAAATSSPAATAPTASAAKPQVVAKTEEAPRMRGLEPPAAGQPAEAKAGAAPAVATTLPPVVEPVTPPAATVAANPTPSNPAPEPEPDEPDEVPLKLINYVPPEMNRHVMDAMGGRDHSVPVRFTVEPNGTVSQADPRPGVQRKLGQSAAAAIKQWKFSPLPERRVVDVELMFRAAVD